MEKENIIDSDSQPPIPEGWTIEQNQKSGKFVWNPDELTFYVSPYQVQAQEDEKLRGAMNAIYGWCLGDDLVKELSTKKVLNASVLEHLLKHQELIPDAWKKDSDGITNYIFFWGTIYHTHENANTLVVRYLYWDGEKWSSDDHRFLTNFDSNCLALVFKNPIQEKFNQQVSNIVDKIFNISTPELTSNISKAIEEQTNVTLDEGTKKGIWLEIAYLGIYIFKQRISNSFSAEEKTIIGELFRDSYSRYLFSIIPQESKDYGSMALNDTDARIDIQKKLLKQYDFKIKIYNEYRGDIVLAFKNELSKDFKHSSSKIQFADNILHKIRLNFSEKPINKSDGKVVFPDSLLTKIATDIIQTFRQEKIVDDVEG